MYLADRLTLDAPKRTKDGFMAVRAKAARAGVYDYAAFEVGGIERGFKAADTVKVYRPESEVFAPDSVASFLAKPVTNDHPAQPVTADNWKQHARGVNMGALRDGEYLAFDLVMMDAALIADVDSGKRELSNGYSCVLDWTAGTTPDGMAYDAVQRNIRGNHIAVVDKGRAGSECAIKDSNGGKPFAACDANPLAISGLSTGEIKMKITLDGVTVTLTDANEAQAVFDKVKGDADKAIAANAKELADAKADAVKLAAEAVAKDADIAKLTADLAAAAITPEKLRDAAKAYAEVTDKAKALGVAVTEAMDEAAIKKAVVDAKLGDAAKDYTADHIAIAFTALTKDAKTEVKSIGLDVNANDARSVEAAAFDKSIHDLNAWRNPAKAAA